MVACLFYVTLITPFEAAFIEDAESWDAAFQGSYLVLFCCNRIVDGLFLIDMIFNFFLQYPRKGGTGMIRNIKKIRHRYLSGWFGIDFVSLVPFDVIALASDTGSGLVGLRMIRLLRLLKLGRILKAGRIFQRWERRLTVNHSVQTLFKMIFYIVLLCHWMACLWMFCVRVQTDPTETWLYNGGYSDYETMDRYVKLTKKVVCKIISSGTRSLATAVSCIRTKSWTSE